MEDNNCFGKRSRKKGAFTSKKYIVSLALVLCLLALFFVAPVKGQGTILIEESEPMLESWVDGENNSQPYIAAYMTTDFLESAPGRGPSAKAVCVTVSFSGTDESVIQSDNWLTAGIAAQGPDSVHGGCNAIDWGYTFSLMLAPWMYPDPFIHVEVFEGHEWVNCLPGYVESIYCWNAFVPSLTVDSSVTLTMEWTEDTLDYYAKVDETNHFLLSYTPAETANHYFMTGTEGRHYNIIPLGNTVKWLQFHGAWSKYNIGEVGWHSHLRDPKFKAGEFCWINVPFAYSTDGQNSYWDNTLGWGGYPYEDVDASYHFNYIHFYPTPETTLEPDTLLWSGPMKTLTDEYFYVPNIPTINLLEVEMLFNDELIGDQVGSSNLPPPDGTVNMRDVAFVNTRFGLLEGDEGWDYMADVIADGIINMRDLGAVAWNFGGTGTYIYDLTGVTVRFDGETADYYPDDNGCVAIPEGKSYFTVYRNGNTIGAMITFS